MALAPIILREGAHCQVRWKSNAENKKIKKTVKAVSLRPVALHFLCFPCEQRARELLEKVWWIHLISTEARADTQTNKKEAGTGKGPVWGV